jgi:hypothetical protein
VAFSPTGPRQLVLVVGEEVNATSHDLQVATYESDPLERIRQSNARCRGAGFRDGLEL